MLNLIFLILRGFNPTIYNSFKRFIIVNNCRICHRLKSFLPSLVQHQDGDPILSINYFSSSPDFTFFVDGTHLYYLSPYNFIYLTRLYSLLNSFRSKGYIIFDSQLQQLVFGIYFKLKSCYHSYIFLAFFSSTKPYSIISSDLRFQWCTGLSSNHISDFFLLINKKR